MHATTTRVMCLALLATWLAGCATAGRDVDLSAQAFPGEVRSAAACYWAAHRATSADATTAAAPWSGTPWTEARESNLTASSKAAIERDIRHGVYHGCLDARG